MQTQHDQAVYDLAAYVHDKTDCGRSVIRYFTDLALGNRPNVKPYHRLVAARILLDQGFGRPPQSVTLPCEQDGSMPAPGETEREAMRRHLRPHFVTEDDHPDESYDHADASAEEPETPERDGRRSTPTLASEMAAARALIRDEIVDPPATVDFHARTETPPPSVNSIYSQTETPPPPVSDVYGDGEVYSYSRPAPEMHDVSGMAPVGRSRPIRNLARCVRELTDNGRRLIDFLHDVSEGNVEGATEWDRILAGSMIIQRGSGANAEPEVPDGMTPDEGHEYTDKLRTLVERRRKYYLEDPEGYERDHGHADRRLWNLIYGPHPADTEHLDPETTPSMRPWDGFRPILDAPYHPP